MSDGNHFSAVATSLVEPVETMAWSSSRVAVGRPPRRVVVVTYNNRSTIEACLGGLRREFVVVVDNASVDDTVERVRRTSSRLLLVRNPVNRGFAAAANQGIAAAEGADVVLVNPDAVVSSDLLDHLALASRRTGAGLVAPRLLNPDGSVQASAREFPTFSRLLARRTRLARTKVGRRLHEQYLNPSFAPGLGGLQPVDWVMGAVMYLPRAALDVVDGFDERFFLYGEDVDLCARLWRAGLPVLYDTEQSAVHGYARASRHTFDLRRPETRHHWASIMRLARRYPRQFCYGRPMSGSKDGLVKMAALGARLGSRPQEAVEVDWALPVASSDA